MWVVMASPSEERSGFGYETVIPSRTVCAYVTRELAEEHIKCCLVERDVLLKRQRARRAELHVRFPSRFTRDGHPTFTTPRNPTSLPPYAQALQDCLAAEAGDINRWDTQSYKDGQTVDYVLYPVVIATSPKDFETERYVMDDILLEAGQDPLITP